MNMLYPINMLYRVAAFCRIAALAGALAWCVFAAGRPALAEALLLVDVETGKVISEQNATTPWYPASVTKLMTTYVTLNALRAGHITGDTLFTVSPHAVAQQPSKMGFKAGTRLTVDNALKMMLVHSANDMAVVLAEGVSGSVDRFTAKMNAAARQLGMTQTNYVNPNGLPDEGQITSARDLAILARALIRDFPEYDDYWHIPSIRFGRKTYRNTNKMIDSYAGSDGMKTGFICASGYNLVATATRGGKRLIAVVLGATSGTGRAVKAAQLFERGFGTDPLSWMTSSATTVDALEPVDAPPPDLHEEVCSRERRQPPADDEDEANRTAASAAGSDFTLGDWPLAGMRGASVLTPGLTAGVAPVDVYTGPARPAGYVAPPEPPPLDKKKKPAGVAAKPDKPAANKPAANKPVKPAPGASKPATTGAASGPPPRPHPAPDDVQ